MNNDIDAAKRFYQEARFGMFIHWGLYSQLGGRWQGRSIPRSGESTYRTAGLSEAEYIQSTAPNFRAEHFDADAWVRLAKRAGMRWITYTAKHLDGFAMYHSAIDSNIVDDTPCGRDPLAELAAACRRHGLRLGIYYSQVSDYFADDLKEGPASPAKDAHLARKNLPQLSELLTNYGDICQLWFDGSPKKLTRQQQERVYRHVKSHQRGCLCTDRLSDVWYDIRSMVDNQAPAMPVDGIWECPGTMNHTWGFKHDDEGWKSVEQLLAILIGNVSKGGNYLLNIGPMADGRFPRASIERLEAIGDWMALHGESIHGCGTAPWRQDPLWGHITRRENTLYLHILQRPSDGVLELPGLRTPVRQACWLADGRGLRCESDRIPGSDLPLLRIHLADAPATSIPVIRLDCTDEPVVDDRLCQWGDGRLILPAHRALVCRPVDASDDFHPCLTPAGAIAWWKNEAFSLRWRCQVQRPGRYRVVVQSPNFWHLEMDGPWTGGARLRCRVAGDSCEGILEGGEAGDDPRWRYYEERLITLGSITLTAGEQEVELSAPHIPVLRPSLRPYGVGLAQLRFHPQ